MADHLIGLMSGTSMDGIDAVLVRFDDTALPELIARRTTALPSEPRKTAGAAQPGANELDRMMRLDGAVARLFAHAVVELLDQTGMKAPARFAPSVVTARPSATFPPVLNPIPCRSAILA